MRTEEDIERETPEESYHRKLGEMISKVKAETKWRDIFKIVEEAQKRLNEKEFSSWGRSITLQGRNPCCCGGFRASM